MERKQHSTHQYLLKSDRERSTCWYVTYTRITCPRIQRWECGGKQTKRSLLWWTRCEVNLPHTHTDEFVNKRKTELPYINFVNMMLSVKLCVLYEKCHVWSITGSQLMQNPGCAGRLLPGKQLMKDDESCFKNINILLHNPSWHFWFCSHSVAELLEWASTYQTVRPQNDHRMN